MLTNQAIEEIKRRTEEFFKRQDDKPVSVWSPTITEEEKAERNRMIASGQIPF